MNNNNKIVSTTVSLSLIVGLAIYQLLQSINLPVIQNYIITYLASTAFYEIVFRLLTFLFSNVTWLKKLIWGKLFLDGYWLYTYEINGVKRYGAWCIKQNYNCIEVKGFGIANDKTRRSDVQSISQLLKRNNDYEIVNMRRDVIDGAFSDTYFYSKTSLHLHLRNTFLNICNYPTTMDGVTIVYGGERSGSRHGNLVFYKIESAQNENDIEKIVGEKIDQEISYSGGNI
ncbi:MAG: hypothetical protein IJF88_06910 [Oscillospiraceae bacterium]|nr:hypothetical protein [Oscillospiraceae bacterium]